MKRHQQFLQILKKDFTLQYNDFLGLVAVFLFCISLLLILHFAFALEKKLELFAGSYWICFFFSHVLFFQRNVFLEKKNGGLMRLLLTPTPRFFLMLSKVIMFFCSSLFLQFLLLLAFSIFFGRNFFYDFKDISLLLMLVSLGFCILGTFVASLSLEISFSEVITPLLLFPLSIPLLLPSIELMQARFLSSNLLEVNFIAVFLLGFNLLYLLICWLCYELVLD